MRRVFDASILLGISIMADVVPFPVDRGDQHVVLIVDDELVILSFLSEHLRDCGFTPLTASSADEAIRLIRLGGTIDLVFSDVRMPGELDGYGLARWMSENCPNIPVILVSGDLGKVNAAAQLRDIETMAKPYDFNAIVKKFRATIAHHKQRHAGLGTRSGRGSPPA
jgi:DNA-binding NtrC family response regulator